MALICGKQEFLALAPSNKLAMESRRVDADPTGFKFCDFMQSWHILGEKILLAFEFGLNDS